MHSIFVAVSSTYTFVSTPRTWSDASADCVAHGGTLATVPNAAAQSALMSSIDLSAIGGETAEERGTGGFWVLDSLPSRSYRIACSNIQPWHRSCKTSGFLGVHNRQVSEVYPKQQHSVAQHSSTGSW